MRKAIFLIIFVSIASFSLANGSALSLFVKGEDAYKAQDYAQAIEYYEEILAADKESGALYFNLGNAYYKTGNIGKAILNYRRAQAFMPRDRDLKFNLTYAESFVQKTENPKRTWVQKLIFGHTKFYTVDEMILILTFSLFALGIFFLLSRFLKWTKTVRYTTRWICAGLFIIFAIGLILKAVSEKDQAIVLNKTPAYFEPVLSSTEHFQLYEGVSIQVVDRQDDWVKVKRSDGRLGWVPRLSIEEI